jgi:hypothetical protein
VFNTKATQKALAINQSLESREDSELEAVIKMVARVWELLDARNSLFVDSHNIYPEVSVFIWERKEFKPIFPRIVEGYPNIVPSVVSIIDSETLRKDEVCRVKYEPLFLNWTKLRDIWHRGLILTPERYGEKGRAAVLDLLKKPYDIARLMNYFQQFYG